jgi:hypothetical protein
MILSQQTGGSMIITFGIRIVGEDGNGVKDAEVAVHSNWAIDHGDTDEDGWVRFEKHTVFGNAIRTAIYVNGELRGDGIWIENEDTFAFSV